MWHNFLFVSWQLKADVQVWVMPLGLIVLYGGLLHLLNGYEIPQIVSQGFAWIGLGLVFKVTWGGIVGGQLSQPLCDAMRGHPYKIFTLAVTRLYILTGIYSVLLLGCLRLIGWGQGFAIRIPVVIFYLLTLQGLMELLLLRARAANVSAYLLLFPLELPLYIFIFEYHKLALEKVLQLTFGFVGLAHLLLVVSIFLMFRWEKSCNSEILSLH